MKRFFALALVAAIVTLGVPTASFAAPLNNGTISGIARTADGAVLANVTVPCRNIGTGAVAGTTTTNAAGAFTFSNLSAGSYVVELVDNSGKTIGAGPTVNLNANQMTVSGVAVTGNTAAYGAAAGAAAGGAAFFKTKVGILVTAAVAGGIAAAVIATRDSSSPSK
jgi:hypothetical protein